MTTRALRLLCAPGILCFASALAHAESAIELRPRDPAWVKRHEEFVAIARQGNVEVLFVGDSITDFWRRDDKKSGGKKIWDQHFAPLKAANFGISGDRTQHVLWRLENGELEGITPKVVVLMIGTNNTGFERDGKTVRNTPPETAAGVTAIVKKLRASLPQTKILLLGIFPRGEKPDNPSRREIAEINATIAKLADGKTVRYLDLGPRFLDAAGVLPREFMPDFLHPGELGYEMWADAIKAPLAAMLK